METMTEEEIKCLNIAVQNLPTWNESMYPVYFVEVNSLQDHGVYSFEFQIHKKGWKYEKSSFKNLN